MKPLSLLLVMLSLAALALSQPQPPAPPPITLTPTAGIVTKTHVPPVPVTKPPQTPERRAKFVYYLPFVAMDGK